MSQTQELANQAERLLTTTDVTIIGILIVIVIASWVIIYKIWIANKELNKEIRDFIGKYYSLSTKILSYLSKGNDV